MILFSEGPIELKATNKSNVECFIPKTEEEKKKYKSCLGDDGKQKGGNTLVISFNNYIINAILGKAASNKLARIILDQNQTKKKLNLRNRDNTRWKSDLSFSPFEILIIH